MYEEIVGFLFKIHVFISRSCCQTVFLKAYEVNGIIESLIAFKAATISQVAHILWLPTNYIIYSQRQMV